MRIAVYADRQAVQDDVRLCRANAAEEVERDGSAVRGGVECLYGRRYVFLYIFHNTVAIRSTCTCAELDAHTLHNRSGSSAQHLACQQFERGADGADNPESDIAGANGHGWHSILLRTGVYKDGVPAHQPTMIAENVQEGVLWALQREIRRHKGDPIA